MRHIIKFAAFILFASLAAATFATDKTQDPAYEEFMKLKEQYESEIRSIAGMEKEYEELKTLLSGTTESPEALEIEKMKREISTLENKKTALEGRLAERSSWIEKKLPAFIAEKKEYVAKPAFELTESGIKGVISDLTPFKGRPETDDLLEEAEEALEVYQKISGLLKAVDSPLAFRPHPSFQSLLTITAEAESTRQLLASEEEENYFSERILTPLKHYQECARTFMALTEGYNSVKQVEGMRKYVKQQPSAKSSFKQNMLDEFNKYCKAHPEDIKSLEKVPYFKRVWKAYCDQIKKDPFATIEAEEEVASLNY
ncbi:MAG: hypothetical protein K2F64_01235 [Muribaculaceae bacterium]|nr:hypothetical protein [Muribaculaceae bacterium]